MMIRSISAVTALALAIAPVIAQAETTPMASISAVSGDVLVNQGQGFKPATPGTVLHPGDRVIVTVNGKAKLLYGGGCGVPLAPGTMATISTFAPCKIGFRQAGIISGSTVGSTVGQNEGGGGGPLGLNGNDLALLTVGLFTLGAIGLTTGFGHNASNNNQFTGSESP
jgi:hypothetical protein